MRGDPRRPKAFQHVQLTTHAVKLQGFGKPAQFVLLVHAAQTQRALVQWGKTKGIGLPGFDQARAGLQPLKHEPAVVGRGLGLGERGCMLARPGVPAGPIGRVEGTLLRNQHNVGSGLQARAPQEFFGQLGADTGRVSAEQGNGG